MTDGELVRQVLDGRTSAYGELARRWAACVLAVCHARTGSRHAAEDLAQESLLRGLRALPTLHEPDKFGPWLRGIATRVCLDWRKAKQTHQVAFGALPEDPSGRLADGGEAPGDRLDRAEQVRQLLDQVEALPDAYREVVMLYYYQDVTYQELADALGVSPATVNSRLTKARAMLRSRLSEARREA
jgi:RNA polymerase sigma-70 factor (ECF subfamily)